MPLSEERFAQIRELSNDERVDRLDTSGFDDADWKRLDAELSSETLEFCRGNSNSEELHAFAATWNWDKGVWALREILRNPACEAATALMIYWQGCPEFYLQYADRRAVEAAMADVELFDFLTEIEARHIAGEFRVGAIAFDPTDPESSPSGLSLVGQYEHHRDKFVRTLSPLMYSPIP